jgi:hypothetical protein
LPVCPVEDHRRDASTKRGRSAAVALILPHGNSTSAVSWEVVVKRSASSSQTRKRAGVVERNRMPFSKLRDVMVIAEKKGLLRGKRTQMIRGTMPEALVKRAKEHTGIVSDTELIEVALANIAVGDDYTDWLLSRRGW